MRFAVFCNDFGEKYLEAVKHVIDCLESENLETCLHADLKKALDSDLQSFHDRASLEQLADILVSVGGDGTILNAVRFVYGSKIPVVGVNAGRLGYLTSVNPDEFSASLKEIAEKKFKIEERSLLEIESDDGKQIEFPLALNEISVLKKDSSSMIRIQAYLDGAFLNTYWADGLIISTATGSTAYSLSCGGPIMAPGSGNLIITPIAPHNLNVRPLVIPDTSLIELHFEARSEELLLALDSYSRIIPDDVKVRIKKATHKIGLLRSDQYSYLETLRTKLNWGLDKRN